MQNTCVECKGACRGTPLHSERGPRSGAGGQAAGRGGTAVQLLKSLLVTVSGVPPLSDSGLWFPAAGTVPCPGSGSRDAWECLVFGHAREDLGVVQSELPPLGGAGA